jgi:hypothetical protein
MMRTTVRPGFTSNSTSSTIGPVADAGSVGSGM